MERIAPVTSIAALYDIHGNLPALEATLERVAADGVDLLLIGGDVLLGPMPRETLDVLCDYGPRARFIRGNCDRIVVDAFDGKLSDRIPPAVRESIEWVARQLDRRDRDFLESFPLTLSVHIASLGDVLFCHASPRSDEENITILSPPERVRPMMQGVSAPTVVCGHTHMQFDRDLDGTRLINAGSVGMPFAPPGAYWLRLGPGIQLMRTDYDLAAGEQRVRRTGYPEPETFLRTMTTEQALRVLEPSNSAAGA